MGFMKKIEEHAPLSIFIVVVQLKRRIKWTNLKWQESIMDSCWDLDRKINFILKYGQQY